MWFVKFQFIASMDHNTRQYLTQKQKRALLYKTSVSHQFLRVAIGNILLGVMLKLMLHVCTVQNMCTVGMFNTVGIKTERNTSAVKVHIYQPLQPG